MAELKMGEFGVSKYGEAIYIASSVLHPPNLAWTVLTAGYLQLNCLPFLGYREMGGFSYAHRS